MLQPSLIWRERQSESPLVASVWSASTPIALSRTVIADPCISIMLIKDSHGSRVVLAGPGTTPYRVRLSAGYSCIAIRLKTGVAFKHFPAQSLLNTSRSFSADNHGRFTLAGMSFQLPNFEQAEHLVDQLLHTGQLRYVEPYGAQASQISQRAYDKRIRRLTGLPPYKLYQLQRMHQVLRLLKQGMPAADVASELAFVDQPHLIRASRQFLGYTPGHLSELPQTAYK